MIRNCKNTFYYLEEESEGQTNLKRLIGVGNSAGVSSSTGITDISDSRLKMCRTNLVIKTYLTNGAGLTSI
jgi:hypothetical protein